MQPEVVARTLAAVEDQWRSQASDFVACNEFENTTDDCSASQFAFEKACSTVVGAVVKASGGDREILGEYMGKVCGQASLEGWRREQCQGLASLLSAQMTASTFENREAFDSAKLCQKVWTQRLTEERGRVVAERRERAQEQTRQAEERKREEERVADEETAARARREEEQEAQRAEEARQEAEKVAANIAEQRAAESAAEQREATIGQNTTGAGNATAAGDAADVSQPVDELITAAAHAA